MSTSDAAVTINDSNTSVFYGNATCGNINTSNKSAVTCTVNVEPEAGD